MLLRKGLTFGIVLLLIVVSIIPSTGIKVIKQSTVSTLDGNTLYVGGNGTGNYSSIQDAIDNASYGDTVFNDIEITISAGVIRNKWGNIGFGWVIKVDNNCNHNITGFCIIDYYTLSGDFIRSEMANFHLGPLFVFGYEGINIIDFPPINRLTITVEADSKTASRSGIEIGPFVIFNWHPAQEPCDIS